MRKRRLGKTGLMISELGYGAVELDRMDGGAASYLLNQILDSGINYIDTAPCYGSSEDLIGKSISNRRTEFYLASKCGCSMADSKNAASQPAHLYSSKILRRNIENSLKLLRTDYIDVWQLHNAMPEDLAGGRNDDVLKTMLGLKNEGKIRYIAASFKHGRPEERLYPAGFGYTCMKEFSQWGVFDVMQIVYGGLTRKNENIISQAAGNGIGIVVRGVLKQYLDEYGRLFDKARLSELCIPGETMNGFLIRFALSHPDISTILIGTANSEHLAQNVRAVELGGLTEDLYRQAKRRLDSIGITADKL